MKTLIIFTLSLIVSNTYAGTIFEPTLTLGGANTAVSTTIGTDTYKEGIDFTVGSLGFRYGITRRYINITGLVEWHTFHNSTRSIDTEFIGFGGLGIGYEWNIPLRTYIIIGALDFDTDYMGGGLELSYYISDSFWVGLRYMNMKKNISTTVQTNTFSGSVDITNVAMVMTFPIEFTYPDHWFRKTDWD